MEEAHPIAYKTAPLTAKDAERFVQLATREAWSVDPDAWHSMEWEMRTRALRQAAKGARGSRRVCAALDRLSRRPHLARWFA